MSFVDDKYTISQSSKFASHDFTWQLADTVNRFYTVSAMRSVGKINTTVNTNFSEIKQTATTKPPAVVMRNLLQAVIPGILAGVLLIFLALLLFYLSRKIGIIRVGANRSEAVEAHSCSEVGTSSFCLKLKEATVQESVENLRSPYDSVERRNVTLQSRMSVTNPVYQRDEDIVFQTRPTGPGKKNVIYDEPFGYLPGRMEGNASATSLAVTTATETDPSRYQQLGNESPEKVTYASRYAIPKRSKQELHCEAQSQESNDDADSRGSPRKQTEQNKNAELQKKYILKDISVEDMEMGHLENTDDLMEEFCIPPSVLNAESTPTKCGSCQDGSSNKSYGENFQDTSSTSKILEASHEQTIQSGQQTSCKESEATTNIQFSPKGKLKKFFEMSL